MKLSFNTNIGSLKAQNQLLKTSERLGVSLERLSSGLRINRAGDDPAGLSIANALELDQRVYAQGVRNLNDGISVLTIADQSLEALSTIVTRLSELAEQSANGVYSSKQRQALDQEAQALSAEYFRISKTTEFNGLNLLDGSMGELWLQAGYGSSSSLAVSVGGAIGAGTFSEDCTFIAHTRQSGDVAAADLNGDGIMDFITVGQNSTFKSEVAVYLGQGDGDFVKHSTYVDSSGLAKSVKIVDLNNDGIMDMATGGSLDTDGAAVILLGQGNGSFVKVATYATESSTSHDISFGDVNGDGYIDMVSAGLTDGLTGEATVFIGNGNGTFGEVGTYATQGSASRAVSLGDINGDGLLDLVTAGYGGAGAGLTVFMGCGDGSFGTGTSYYTESWGSRSLALQDINGDGMLDIATAGNQGGSGAASVFINQGDGTFNKVGTFATESSPGLMVQLGDVNGDGIVDLVSGGTNGSVGEATLFHGNGDGTFTRISSYSSQGELISSGTLADLNGDGVLDLLTLGWNGSAGDATLFFGDTKDGVAPLLPFDLTSAAGARQSLPVFQQKLEQLSSQRGQIGAFQSRLTFAVSTLGATVENYSAAGSRIMDVDIAQEAAEMVRQQILQQAGAAVLAQANQQSGLVLRLLT